MRTYQVRAVTLDTVLISGVACGLSYLRSTLDPTYSESPYRGLELVVVIATWLSVMVVEGAYNMRYLGTGVQEFKVVTRASFKGFLFLCLLALATNQHPPRLNLFLGWVGSVFIIALGRKFLQLWLYADRRAGKSLRNTIILGSAEYAEVLTNRLAEQSHLGLHVLGHIPLDLAASRADHDEWLEAIDKGISKDHVKVLIVEDSQDSNAALLSRLSWHLNSRTVEMLVAPTFLKQFGPRLDFESHPELPLAYIDEPVLSLSERLIKRLLDIFLASLALILLLPLMILISFGVFVSSPGPVFFIQNRVGLAGIQFKFIKFRTMVVGAENMRQDILGTPDDEMAERYRNDPRIYPFGRILRRFSLDELPQLISVIGGSMSLVGPRPLLVEELALLGDEDHRRHLTKPGLTGLWQISGRKETTWDERIQMDLQYVHNWTLGLDLGIMIKTIKVLLSGHGSY